MTVVFLALLFASPAMGQEKVHIVASGHTLGKIAKRYHVTVEALCEANGIQRRAPLKPGQRIVIPNPPSKGKVKADSSESAATGSTPRTSPSKRRAEETEDVVEDGPFTSHLVASGHTLGKIAQRYRTTVEAIRGANGLEPRQPLKVGICLKVPLTQRSTQRHRSQVLPCVPQKVDVSEVERERRPSEALGVNNPNAGMVHLVRGGRTFRGRLLDRKGKVLPEALTKVDALLFDRRTSKTHGTDPGLLAKIVQVSDHFGGRRLIVVSGFREEASNPHTTHSKHALGRAIDFRVEGVTNESLRDYCHTLSGVGVGYYPNSSFVHLDVRDITTHWTDISGPGEAPNYTSIQNPSVKKSTK